MVSVRVVSGSCKIPDPARCNRRTPGPLNDKGAGKTTVGKMPWLGGPHALPGLQGVGRVSCVGFEFMRVPAEAGIVVAPIPKASENTTKAMVYSDELDLAFKFPDCA